jgi:hypothetical protein
MTKSEIQAMLLENVALKSENENLVKEQKEFQQALKTQIDRIKGLGPWKRFWAAAQLVIDLIGTIEAGFRNN